MKSLDEVRQFWERNPLWSGETRFEPGTLEYFEEHRAVYINDCFAGRFDERVLPPTSKRRHVLDLGCGPGFWTVELVRHGCERITAADLTERALELTQQRCTLYGVDVELRKENAEQLTFENGTFSHVNCQGVIHHTPDTEATVREMARVLEPGGTASISVYYRNVFLWGWPVLRHPSRLLAALGAGMRGRGREGIYTVEDVDEIVRLYDGAENPIGKSYSKQQFKQILEPHFRVGELFLHFFPARTLPFRVPPTAHRVLDRYAGFMVYATVTKR